MCGCVGVLRTNCSILCVFCFFNDTATTDIYTYLHTLSRHDALPIWRFHDGGPAVAEDLEPLHPVRSAPIREEHPDGPAVEPERGGGRRLVERVEIGRAHV